MYEVLMIGEPLLIEENHCFCKHKKLPKVIDPSTPRAIRLKNMSRLRKLGEGEFRPDYRCNEYSCGCLWSQHGYRPSSKNERFDSKLELKPVSLSQEYKTFKAKNLRTQILNKFRDSLRNREKRLQNDDLLNSRKSVVWLMRPSKKLRDSETNIPKSNKLTTTSTTKQKPFSSQRSSQSQKSMSRKSQNSSKLTTTLSCNTTRDNLPSHIGVKHKVTKEKFALQKGTKDYYNECKKIQDKHLVQRQMAEPNTSPIRNQRQSNIDITQTSSVSRGSSKKKESKKKTTELYRFQQTFEKQQNITRLTKRFDSNEYFKAIFGDYSDDEVKPEFGGKSTERKCSCDLCKCKLKMENYMVTVEQTSSQIPKTIKGKQFDMTALSSPSLGNSPTYKVESTRNISDYMWLKRTDTQIELSNSSPIEEVPNITEPAKIMTSSENVSKASMKVNFSESTTRLADFGSDLALEDQESELAKEKIFSPKEGELVAQEHEVPKELRYPAEEKEAASVTTIDDENSSPTTSKAKKVPAKKHKRKKLKKNKKKRNQVEPTIETLKSVENVIETEGTEKSSMSANEPQRNADDGSDLISLQFEDRCVSYVELQGSTRQNIRNESFNIFYHKPIKYEKRRSPDVFSTKSDET